MRTIVTTILLTVAAAATAHAGPPWISVEYPANPHHPSTRDALFVVHTYHHSTSIAPPVSASFEGLVDGERRSLPATISRTSRAGMYAVRGNVPADGSWIAVVRMQDGDAPAVALVSLSRQGHVLAVNVPSERRDGWTIPREASSAEIEAALHAVARLAVAAPAAHVSEGGDQRPGSEMLAAGLAGLLLMGMGMRSLRLR